MTVNGRPVESGTAVVTGGIDGAHLIGKGVTTEQLTSSLSGELSARVRDLTALTGTFDYNVVFAGDNNPSNVSELPTLMTALQQELGLRLEKNKGTAEVLVVDHIEKPTPN